MGATRDRILDVARTAGGYGITIHDVVDAGIGAKAASTALKRLVDTGALIRGESRRGARVHRLPRYSGTDKIRTTPGRHGPVVALLIRDGNPWPEPVTAPLPVHVRTAVTRAVLAQCPDADFRVASRAVRLTLAELEKRL